MASLSRSAFDFTRGIGLAVLAIASAITDPLSAAKMIGVAKPEAHWLLGATAMRYLFLAFGVAWAFHWYHGVRKQMERGREADMPLHQVCRWIARDSVWASRYRWPDDQWIQRVSAELFSKWQLGHFEMMGTDGNKGAIGYLPPAMKESSEFEAYKLTHDEPPWHIWSNKALNSDNRPFRFFEVKLDRREVMRVWPRRSILNRLRHKSPIERIDREGYAEIFRKQDKWYAENF